MLHSLMLFAWLPWAFELMNPNLGQFLHFKDEGNEGPGIEN